MSGAFVSRAGEAVAPSGRAARVVAAVLQAARRLAPAAGAVRVVLELPDSAAWSSRVRRGGATVLCARGSVWITREGDPEDRVIEAGEEFRSERPGRLAVVALGAARVVVSGDLGRPPLG